MSSMERRESNPYSKSPIPRSRSDLSYAGLTPRDKRWSADLTHLLPNFNRDATGYLRLLEEGPVVVTNQPKPVKHRNANRSSPPHPDAASQNANYAMQANALNNSAGSTENDAPDANSPLVDLGSLPRNQVQPRRLALQGGSNQNLNRVQESSNVRSPLKSVTNRSPATLQQESSSSHMLGNANVVGGRSPTRDYGTLGPANSLDYSNLGGYQRNANLVASPSLTLDAGPARPRNAVNVVGRGSMSDHAGLMRSPRSAVVSRSPTLDYSALCQHGQRNGNVVMVSRSPTLDPNLLRRSPLARSPAVQDSNRCHPNDMTASSPTQVYDRTTPVTRKVMARSPTLDPKVLRDGPPRPSPTLDSRRLPNPQNGQAASTNNEVVRSQSMRSLRKDRSSPAKLRSSESAHCDVTAPSARGYSTLVEEIEEDDVRRLRNFSLTPKGVVNWGDSFRSQSLSSVPFPDNLSGGSSQWDVASTRSYPMASSTSLGFRQSGWRKDPTRYRVAIMGSDEVGKTSLIRQFQTSEYICAFDNNCDLSSDCAITVILNEEESELEFLDHRFVDEDNEDKDSNQNSAVIPLADAHVIIYSVTNRRSFVRALDALSRVQAAFLKSAVLLVGNKSDLVRVRAVTTDEGATAAREKECPFLETSAAINHQVDELLVCILSQIRARSGAAKGRGGLSGGPLSRAKGLLKRFLKKACFQSRSCDNLQRL